MRKMARILLPIFATVLLIPLAQAQEKKYRFEFFGGASYPIKESFEISSPQSVLPIKGEHKFSAGGLGGVRFGIDGARRWGQDYEYSYGQNASRIETGYGKFAFTNRIHQASTSILFYPWTLDRPAVFPYVDFGLGAKWVTLKQDALNEALDPLRVGLGTAQERDDFRLSRGRWRAHPHGRALRHAA